MGETNCLKMLQKDICSRCIIYQLLLHDKSYSAIMFFCVILGINKIHLTLFQSFHWNAIISQLLPKYPVFLSICLKIMQKKRTYIFAFFKLLLQVQLPPAGYFWVELPPRPFPRGRKEDFVQSIWHQVCDYCTGQSRYNLHTFKSRLPKS